MPEIEFDPVDSIAAGAVGVPGQRTFYIQAVKGASVLSVLVEKEQVAVLSDRMASLLDQLAGELGEPGEGEPEPAGEIQGDPVPLFRAVAIGIGFDPARRMILLELHERPVPDSDDEDDAEADAEAEVPDVPDLLPAEDGEAYLARLYITPAQARAMASRGTASVAAGRPPCPRCGNPLDPEGHACPKLNGHGRS